MKNILREDMTMPWCSAVLLKLFNIVYRHRTFCHSTYQLRISNEKNRQKQVLFNKQQLYQKVKNAFILIF